MAVIVCLALALLSIGVVVYPFWRRLAAPATAPPEALSPDLVHSEADLNAVYDAIRTLQLEHQLGNIPLGLYREQLQDYRLQAAAILRDQAETAARDDEWLLEQDVGLARSALSYTNGAAIQCPNCGAPAAQEWRECPECSAELRSWTADAAETPPK